ncbi:MAG: hypothetical protein ACI9C4_001758 [Paraglaciecola sp.]|jgi:hypothetical protein
MNAAQGGACCLASMLNKLGDRRKFKDFRSFKDIKEMQTQKYEAKLSFYDELHFVLPILKINRTQHKFFNLFI